MSVFHNTSSPTEWKVHSIAPIHKSGDRASVENYRPISLLSSTSKVLERLVHNKMYMEPSCSLDFWSLAQPCSNYWFSSTNYMPHGPSQMWFCEGLWQCAAQSVVVQAEENGSPGWSVEAVSMLPLRKATVCQDWVLSLFLATCGLGCSTRGPLVSSDLPVSSLSSLPFIFADDTKCCKIIVEPADCVHLQNDLCLLGDWGKDWKLNFKVPKCVSIAEIL